MIIYCFDCGTPVKVSDDTIKVICSDCVSEMVDPPVMAKKKSGMPRGWKFMNTFVDSDLNVYKKGILVPDLKGTMDQTIIEVKPRLTKAQKAQEQSAMLSTIFKMKKELHKDLKKGERKKLEVSIRKLERKL